MNDPGMKASTAEYQASLFGSVVIGLGVGVLVASFVPTWLGAVAILLGVLVHGWGMYRIYKRSH